MHYKGLVRTGQEYRITVAHSSEVSGELETDDLETARKIKKALKKALKCEVTIDDTIFGHTVDDDSSEDTSPTT
jgi:hypothetical protein